MLMLQRFFPPLHFQNADGETSQSGVRISIQGFANVVIPLAAKLLQLHFFIIRSKSLFTVVGVGGRGQKGKSLQKTVEFACLLAVRALKCWRQPSGGVQKRQLVTVERHQLNRRSDAIRQQEPRELVQPSTQIEGGGMGGFTRQQDVGDDSGDGDNIARKAHDVHIPNVQLAS